jgi:hypothetical protein
MNQRMSGKQDFSKWLKERDGGNEETVSFLGQIGAIQFSVSSQMQELSGALPDANSLTGAQFRERVSKAVYLLIASVSCALLAVFVGLPTIVLRPAKFVVFMSLTTLFAIGSVIMLQTPGAFIKDVSDGGIEKSVPFGALVGSQLLTLYVAVFVHKYVYTIMFGALQVLSILYYLASFIPGGTKGLEILLRSGYAMVDTACMPCKAFVRRQISSAFSE